MFYSHEVLTSRKYGVATVWLVATLGNKSSLKRINRKQILDVDVSKACQTIVDPGAPLALRLQGNLLYGVSRVYMQQCGYVLSDAQSAHNDIRMMLRTIHESGLDPDAGKARPEQLILPDDQSFLPDFAFAPPALLADLDFSFNLDMARPGESQTLTPFGSQRSQSSSHIGAIGGLILPSSSPSVPGGLRFKGDNGPGSVGGASDMFGAGNILDLDEPDFTFDDDGDIIDFGDRDTEPKTPGVRGGATMSGDAGASARVRREHEEGRSAGVQLPVDDMDIDFPVLGEDLPEGEAFSSVTKRQFSEQSEQVKSSSSTAVALMRRKRRTARALPNDVTIELRNVDLSDWNTDYLQNMKKAALPKTKAAAIQRAKKNAEHYVWGSLGGIGKQFFALPGPSPFDMFTGNKLFELITGVSREKVKGTKHDRDSGIDDETQEQSRRIRQKTGDPDKEMGRGPDDEGFSMPGGDDDEVELPREAETALDDQHIFSAMPWNISASIRGSSVVPRSGLGSLEQGKRGSRLTSASPLHGRGQPGGLEALQSLESEGDYGLGGDDYGPPEPSSDDPELAAHTQTSIRIRDALAAEGENFLVFVAEAIVEKCSRAQAAIDRMADPLQAEAAADLDEITFEQLLPPAENTKIVASQGLMQVLGLGMKGMLDIQQPEHLGEINLRLTQQAKAWRVVEISDQEESEDDNDVSDMELEASREDILEVQEEETAGREGHFQDRIAAGHAAVQDNDHDSLYAD